MSDTTARLGLPIIAPAQAQKHVTHNEALRILDGIIQLVLAGVGTNTPPTNPAAGEVHAIGTAPTGAWDGQAGRLAQWDGGAWAFITPQTGWRAWDGPGARDLVFGAGGWAVPVPGFQNIPGVGINATSDATNVLAVAGPATLLSHGGAGHQVKINKATAGDTASLLYQTGFSGRAEMGLAGNDSFAIKVSPDGTTWTNALSIHPSTGQVSGSAVQANGVDTTPGRIVTTDGALNAALSGFGGYYNASANVNIDTVEPGFAGLVLDSNPGAWPLPPGTGFVLLKTQRLYNGAAVKQTAEYGYANSGTPGNLRRFERVRNNIGTAWSSWTPDHTGATVVGPVSQVAGVPTGALIERGSNANGTYIRMADGTQICWCTKTSTDAQNTAFGALFRTAGQTLTFPVAFVNTTGLMVTSAHSGDTAAWFTFDAPSATGVFARRVGVLNTATNVTYRCIAYGRWF